MKYFILLVGTTIAGFQPAQGFEFIESACSVEDAETLSFKIDENEFESNVRVVFSFEQNLNPSFKIQFFSHKPKKVYLQWKDIDGVDNSAIFNPYLKSSLQTLDGKLVELASTSTVDNTTVFEAKDLDVRQVQTMVALFLSQRTANVVVESDAGVLWSANLSLSGTTKAYKKLASTCMADRATEFLPEDAISTGYGLVNYTKQLSELQGVDESLLITVQSYNSALPLMQQKNKIINQFDAFQSESFLNAINLFKDYATQQQEIQNRLQTISSGVEQQIADVQSTLSATKNSILEESQNITIVTAEIESINQALEPFLPKINEFSLREQELRAQASQVAALIEHLTEMLNEKTLLMPNTDSAPLISPPWSLEIIEKKNAEIVTRTQEYNRIRQQVEALKVLHDSSKRLVDAALQQDAALTQYLGFVSEKTKSETEFQGIESAIRQYQQIPYLADLDDISFIILNTRLEDIITATSERNFDNEFEFHQTKFQQLSEEFDTFKKRNTESKNLIFMNLVCDPKIILDPQLETSPCLNPNELLNTTLRTQLLNSLPPATIDSLLSRVPQPWNEANSKVEILAERVTQELTSSDPELEAMLENWNLLRLIVWRWSSQQRTSEEFANCNNPALNAIDTNTIYNSDFYENVFTCEKQQLNDLEVQKTNQQNRIQELLSKIETSQTGFRSAEEAFNVLVQSFREQVQQMQASAESSTFFEAMYAQCLVPSLNPMQCENSFQQIFTGKAQFEDAVMQLQSQLLQMLDLQNGENNKIASDLIALQLAAADYANQNNFNDLLINKAAALNKITDLEASIKNHNASLVENEAKMLDLQKQKEDLLTEASQLMAKASLLSLKSVELKSVVADICPQILILNTQIAQIDEQIRATLNIPTPAEPSAPNTNPFTQICQ